MRCWQVPNSCQIFKLLSRNVSGVCVCVCGWQLLVHEITNYHENDPTVVTADAAIATVAIACNDNDVPIWFEHVSRQHTVKWNRRARRLRSTVTRLTQYLITKIIENLWFRGLGRSSATNSEIDFTPNQARRDKPIFRAHKYLSSFKHPIKPQMTSHAIELSTCAPSLVCRIAAGKQGRNYGSRNYNLKKWIIIIYAH